ncbi:MAG: hypothetical protein ACK58T_39550, partial [Phycisphaerae bacterium]
ETDAKPLDRAASLFLSVGGTPSSFHPNELRKRLVSSEFTDFFHHFQIFSVEPLLAQVCSPPRRTYPTASVFRHWCLEMFL